MWRKIINEWKWALYVALAGAFAGLIYALATGGAFYPDALRWALTGAILASVVLTAIKIYLDL